MYKTLKVTGNKACDQHTGRDIPARVPGEYFPSPAREGSCWTLGLLLCLAMVGDDPSVPLHCVRGDTQTPAKALGMHSVSSTWPCSPQTCLDPPQNACLRSCAHLPALQVTSYFGAKLRISLSPSAEGTLRRPSQVSRPPGPGRGMLAPSHLGLYSSDIVRSPSSGSRQAGHLEECHGKVT